MRKKRKCHAEYDQMCETLSEIYNILDRLDKTPQELHEEIGLPYHWLQKLIHRKVKNPSINRTMYLYEKLKEMQNA